MIGPHKHSSPLLGAPKYSKSFRAGVKIWLSRLWHCQWKASPCSYAWSVQKVNPAVPALWLITLVPEAENMWAQTDLPVLTQRPLSNLLRCRWEMSRVLKNWKQIQPKHITQSAVLNLALEIVRVSSQINLFCSASWLNWFSPENIHGTNTTGDISVCALLGIFF